MLSVLGLPFKIVGVEGEPVSRILLDNIVVNSASEESVIKYARDILFNEVFINGVVFTGSD